MTTLDFVVLGIGVLLYAPSAIRLVVEVRCNKRDDSWAHGLAILGVMFGTMLIMNAPMSLIRADFGEPQGVLVYTIVMLVLLPILLSPFWYVIRFRNRS